MAYLLDSVILIDHFNGVEAATRYLQEHHHEIAISVITRAEVLTGFDAEREPLAKAVLDQIRHYSVTMQTWQPACVVSTDGSFPTPCKLPLQSTTTSS